MFRSAADALVATVAYFDLFDIALSTAELSFYCFRFDGAPLGFVAVDEQLRPDSRVITHDGFWMLSGRATLAASRVMKGAEVHQKWAVAARAARLAVAIPFVRLFAVCNTMGYGVAKADGDIDTFVIVERRRLWITRWVLTAVLHVARLRRHGVRIANRICLSFYVATDALGIAPLAIDGLDPYLAWWVGSVVPLVDRGAYNDFIVANLPLVQRYQRTFLPRALPPVIFPERSRGASFFASALESLLSGRVGDALEWFFRTIQLRKIARSSQGRVRESSTSVVVSDHVLKFHENDRRAAIRDAWLAQLRELGVKNYE